MRRTARVNMLNELRAEIIVAIAGHVATHLAIGGVYSWDVCSPTKSTHCEVFHT
jgi:hypothetical protein